MVYAFFQAIFDKIFGALFKKVYKYGCESYSLSEVCESYYEKACKILEIDILLPVLTASREARKRYREILRQIHPDTGATNGFSDDTKELSPKISSEALTAKSYINELALKKTINFKTSVMNPAAFFINMQAFKAAQASIHKQRKGRTQEKAPEIDFGDKIDTCCDKELCDSGTCVRFKDAVSEKGTSAPDEYFETEFRQCSKRGRDKQANRIKCEDEVLSNGMKKFIADNTSPVYEIVKECMTGKSAVFGDEKCGSFKKALGDRKFKDIKAECEDYDHKKCPELRCISKNCSIECSQTVKEREEKKAATKCIDDIIAKAIPKSYGAGDFFDKKMTQCLASESPQCTNEKIVEFQDAITSLKSKGIAIEDRYFEKYFEGCTPSDGFNSCEAKAMGERMECIIDLAENL